MDRGLDPSPADDECGERPSAESPRKSQDNGTTTHPAFWSRLAIFSGIATAGCALDLWTKALIFRWPAGPGLHGEWWLVENYVGIQKTLNQGALWGIGQGQVTLFASLSVAAALGILVWVVRGHALRDRILTVALGSVLGGILGNLYDRLGLWGGIGPDGQPLRAVRDWILFCYHEHTWPNFNIADCMLVCGAALLALHALRPDSPAAPAGDPVSK